MVPDKAIHSIIYYILVEEEIIILYSLQNVSPTFLLHLVMLLRIVVEPAEVFVLRTVRQGHQLVLLVPSIGLEMIFCPRGFFMMGSPASETGRGTDETQHQVMLTNGF